LKRGKTGKHDAITGGGETVRGFIPAPLPPVPPLAFEGPLQQSLERALLALGRLDGLSALLPDTGLFRHGYVRKEALVSSQIEGTRSSLSDLLLFELHQAPGALIDDVVEVSNYVAAMEHGLRRLREGVPLSSRFIREIHGALLSHGRGSKKDPGQFRRTQNWIGGSRPGNAVFVPPPPQAVADCMSDLERFLHLEENPSPVVVRAGLAHVQFETIHPFLDGNGRVGRLLVTFLLCQAKVLREPLLCLSLYLKQNRDEYYELLDRVRKDGDWESWLEFFLNGVEQSADSAVSTARRLADLFEVDRDRIQQEGRAAGSALRVHDVLKQRPAISLQGVARRAALSFPAASSGMTLLEKVGVAEELTGKKRNRVFGYSRYLAILAEGTETS
jgi:Fic family protein